MPRALTVTAIVAAYNEEDVIGAVLADLMDQGVRVHLLDHGSTAGTGEEARPRQRAGRPPRPPTVPPAGRAGAPRRVQRDGLLEIEPLDGHDFALARIIRRKE